MFELAFLINFEHHMLLMAVHPKAKLKLRQKMERLKGVPDLTEEQLTHAMKEVQDLFEFGLKSAPDGKLALLASLAIFASMLVHEFKMGRLTHNPAAHGRQGEAAFLAGMIRSVFKHPFPPHIDRQKLIAAVGHLD